MTAPLGGRARRVAVLLVASTLLACGPPPFVVHVSWPGEVDLQEGAAVVYEGVKVGEVEQVSLRQDDPEQAALVVATLGIEDPSVRLRTADRFHVGSLRGVSVVEVEPARRASPPLENGATVAGVPPVLTRLEGEIGEAIESIGEAALEAVEEAIGALERSDADARARAREQDRSLGRLQPDAPDEPANGVHDADEASGGSDDAVGPYPPPAR